MTEEHDEQLESDQFVKYSSRDGLIFVIDNTEPMFEIDPDADKSYFQQCLEAYRNVLSEKLSWNKSHWMGIILMGTNNKWDHDPEMKNVLTWQTFEEVSINQMMKIEKTLQNIEEFRNEIGSSSNYPLHDALWHASRAFIPVKIKMPYRSIILLTRNDNPSANDQAERHRIRVKATDCKSLNLRLSIVGFGKQWNPDNFFAELEIASGKFPGKADYQRTYLNDLEEEVKHGSRTTAKLEWILGDDVKIGISVTTVNTKTKYLKKCHLDKRNNEPLKQYSYYKEWDTRYLEDDDDDDENEENSGAVVLAENIVYYQSFGGRDIKFTGAEKRSMRNMRKPGIELLGFKPQSCLNLSHHLKAPRFVSYYEEKLEGSKKLFVALLKRCAVRKVMPICVVTMRPQSGSYLCAMIPHIDYGGFYAYRLPFSENLREFANIIPQYYYDDTENPCPINKETTDLCLKFIKKSTVAYNPAMFSNPKLHSQLAILESLALDKDSTEIPVDTTIPNKDIFKERLGELADRFKESVLLCDSGERSKRPGTSGSGGSSKSSKLENLDFATLVKQRRVEKCTVVELKEYLKSRRVQPVGKKAELVELVYNLFSDT